MLSDNIIYEQPLNEQLRICLRLENLLQQASFYLNNDSDWASRITLASLLEIVNLLDRPDLKTKLSKALSHRASLLAHLEPMPNVDNQKLKEVLQTVETLVNHLHITPGKLGQNLRDNEFLTTIRLHLAKPGGVNNFNCPAYYYWLQQPADARIRALSTWYQELNQIQTIVNLLLQLTRESSQPQLKFAKQGFYQEALDTGIPYQLIRVMLPDDRKIYPEISVGRHRLSIHFYTPNFEGRAVHVTHEIPFKLACCAI